MIDEPRIVATDASVNYEVVVESQQEGVAVGDVAACVTLVGLVVADSLTGVFVDDLAPGDVTIGERTVPMHVGLPHVIAFPGRLDPGRDRITGTV
ncbi:MAG: hypothetical protein WDO56_05040 [Gammaproteobacteria bacterium]